MGRVSLSVRYLVYECFWYIKQRKSHVATSRVSVTAQAQGLPPGDRRGAAPFAPAAQGGCAPLVREAYLGSLVHQRERRSRRACRLGVNL